MLGPLQVDDFVINCSNIINFDDEKQEIGKIASNKSIIHGQIDKMTQVPNGIIRQLTKNSNILEAQFVDGIPNGFARLILSDASYYIGQYKNH